MDSTTVHCFQHAPFEGPALFKTWAEEQGHAFRCTPLYLGHRVPDLAEARLLLVMGGPMGVYDSGRFPWLRDEKRAIESALRAGIRVVGICLGAQLIADVLGAPVYGGPSREIGWFPIERTAEADALPLGRAFPERLDVFHWHGDTFDLPAGATLLARSRAYEHQAFAYQGIALGLQFHMEMGREQVEAMVDNCREELTTGPYIQTEKEILAGSVSADAAGTVLFKLLDIFLG